MMSLADILQLVVLCALLFFPLGYLTRHYQRRIRTTLRLMFFKPRYVKPAGSHVDGFEEIGLLHM